MRKCLAVSRDPDWPYCKKWGQAFCTASPTKTWDAVQNAVLVSKTSPRRSFATSSPSPVQGEGPPSAPSVAVAWQLLDSLRRVSLRVHRAPRAVPELPAAPSDDEILTPFARVCPLPLFRSKHSLTPSRRNARNGLFRAAGKWSFFDNVGSCLLKRRSGIKKEVADRLSRKIIVSFVSAARRDGARSKFLALFTFPFFSRLAGFALQTFLSFFGSLTVFRRSAIFPSDYATSSSARSVLCFRVEKSFSLLRFSALSNAMFERFFSTLEISNSINGFVVRDATKPKSA